MPKPNTSKLPFLLWRTMECRRLGWATAKVTHSRLLPCYPHPNGAEPYLSEGFALCFHDKPWWATWYYTSSLLSSVGARLQNFSKKSKVSVLLENCEYVSSSDTLPNWTSPLRMPKSSHLEVRVVVCGGDGVLRTLLIHIHIQEVVRHCGPRILFLGELAVLQ